MASPALPTPQQAPRLLCRGWNLRALLLLCWALQPLPLTLEQPVELCCWSARRSSAHQAAPLPQWALLLLPSFKGHSSECQSWMVVCGARGEKRRKSFSLLCYAILQIAPKFYSLMTQSLQSLLRYAIVQQTFISFLPSSEECYFPTVNVGLGHRICFS